MNFPSLPTDSLYKFLAIGGIMMVAIANYVTFQATISMQDLRFKENQAHFGRHLERTDKAIEGVRKDHDEKADRSRDLANALHSINEYSRIERKDVQKRIEEMETESKALIVRMSWMNIFGFLTASIGFAAWWLRVQRYLDETIRLERDKAKAELKKLS